MNKDEFRDFLHEVHNEQIAAGDSNSTMLVEMMFILFEDVPEGSLSFQEAFDEYESSY